ncbi:MAG: endonuclease/exonuclease/phosphatase family protein [Bacteroidota bacterium]
MKRPLRLAIMLILVPVGLMACYLISVIIYASITDLKPPPLQEAQLLQKSSLKRVPDTISLLTWNLGYAGLGAEADFFYDGGKTVRMPEVVVQGYLKGLSLEIKRFQSEVDFFLFQEVDQASRRSYGLNQVDSLSQILPDYAGYFAKNYQVGFVPMPIFKPLGKVKGGLASFSKYQPIASQRHQLEGNYAWPTKLFFLDRCFLLQRYPLANMGRELVVINVHNSAYDDGSLKQKQMNQLKEVLLAEQAKGNYVIAGGDWNQFPPDFRGVGAFLLEETEADSNAFVPSSFPTEEWQWAYDPAIPTNRSLAAPFDDSTTFRSILDFFLVSPHVEVLEVRTKNLGFAFSDHQAVQLTVVLSLH